MSELPSHRGQTASVIGRGPSLLELQASDIGPGPVLTLNTALLRVRSLGLPNPIYSLQKPGCLVEPQMPETVIHVPHSAHCWRDYPQRVVLDIWHLFGLTGRCMSATLAVAVAGLMGCARIRMLCQDGFTRGDLRAVEDGERVVDNGGRGYRWAGQQASQYARAHHLALEWVC